MSIFDIFRSKKKIDAPWSKYYTEGQMNYKIPNISMYDQVRLSKIRYPKNIAIKYLSKKINYKKFLKKRATA